MALRRLSWALGLVLLGGGCHALPDPTDQVVANLARQIRDLSPAEPAGKTATPDRRDSAPALEREDTGTSKSELGGPPLVQPTALRQQDNTLPVPKKQPLSIPPELPGATAPPISWPKTRPEQDKVLKKLYPPLPPLPVLAEPAPGPDGKLLTLADLQSLAAANNPSIKNAVAAVDAAKGAAFQAGAYPNPGVFWEADTVGTTAAGYQGAGFDQVIKSMNKIKLTKAAATMDLRNAEVALRKAQSDLATQVRTNYFAVLVALENVKVSRALARFTDHLYRIQVDLLSGGQAAAYEPMQLRPVALQARYSLIQAINQYQASWRQLAAALGLPSMPPTQVAGRVDWPVPVYDYEDVKRYVLDNHTDVLTGLNALQKARYALELAQVTPVPDPDVHVLIQKDYTTPLRNLWVYSVAVTLPVPLWDRNKGNIFQAKNLLIQAGLAPQQTRLQLTNTLADAFNRYATARDQVQIAMQQIEDQVRAFRGVYERHGEDPDAVGFGDVVTAQQTLASYISGYVSALGLQWQAVVDIANLLQTEDLFQVRRTQDMAPVPDLERLVPPLLCPPGAAGLSSAAPSSQAATWHARPALGQPVPSSVSSALPR
jgi:cobalt-zinc-cadmium efflux system outer membrane protein